MCEPASITMGVVAVLSAAEAVHSANQQKHALEDQAKLQQEQTDEAAQAQTNDRIKAAREQRAAARAASAESGASGNSANAILTDLLMQSGRDVSRIEKNRENGQLSNQQQARAASEQIEGQLVAGLSRAAGSGADAAMSGYKARQVWFDTTPGIDLSGTYYGSKPKVSLDTSAYTIKG